MKAEQDIRMARDKAANGGGGGNAGGVSIEKIVHNVVTNAIMSLDEVNTGGVADVRVARKAAVKRLKAMG
jgi:hypothetical protein